MGAEARGIEELRGELEDSRKAAEELRAALAEVKGTMVAAGLLNSLLLALFMGISVYLAVRFALRRGAL